MPNIVPETQISICNLALARLGQGDISSLADGSIEAKYCNKFWDTDRQAALRDYPWSFAMSNPTPLFPAAPCGVVDYAYTYKLPSDCLRALRLYDAARFPGGSGQAGMYPPTDINLVDLAEQTLTELMFFEVRTGRILVTNLAPATLTYIVNITDVTMFDPQFIEAFSYRLAVDLALPVTGNATFAQAMTGLYKASLLAARTADAREGKRSLKFGKSFLQSRR